MLYFYFIFLKVPLLVIMLQLEFIKNNMKACESREELESLKLSQKNLINKVWAIIVYVHLNIMLMLFAA